jgi:hypothetical protein
MYKCPQVTDFPAVLVNDLLSQRIARRTRAFVVEKCLVLTDHLVQIRIGVLRQFNQIQVNGGLLFLEPAQGPAHEPTRIVAHVA